MTTQERLDILDALLESIPPEEREAHAAAQLARLESQLDLALGQQGSEPPSGDTRTRIQALIDAALAGLSPAAQRLMSSRRSSGAAGAVPPSTSRTVLAHAQGWDGSDFEECLETVYRTRLPVEL